MQTLHLFAGAGGGLLADLILGHTPIGAVEFDPYCCRVLRERAADGWFPGLRVHEGDIRLFDTSEYAGRVDCLHAGFPCQPHSVAGKREGEDDERNLWPDTSRIIGQLRPRFALLENVPGIVSNGYAAVVVGELSALGYDCRWAIISAADAGAPHRRERWWCLAELADTMCYRRETYHGREPLPNVDWNNSAHEAGWKEQQPWTDGGSAMANPARFREREQADEDDAVADCREAWHEPVCGSERLPDTIIERLERQQQGRPTPWPAYGPGHGCAPGWWQVEPGVGRVVDGLASRVDRLKALGNGQVPLQAALAWRILGGP